MNRQLVHLSLAALTAFTLTACGSTSDQAPPADNSAAESAGAAEGSMPAGHPPTGGGGGSSLPAVPDGAGTGAMALEWDAPEGWEWVQPANAMRRAQYSVPGEAGAAEFIVYYFGPGQGGDAMSNAIRWAGQFTQPDGSSSQDQLKTESIQVGEMPVMMIEVTGTYGGGMPGMGAGGASKLDHKLLGAVAEGPDANWFFKLTGPSATVDEQRSAFEALVNSLKPGA